MSGVENLLDLRDDIPLGSHCHRVPVRRVGRVPIGEAVKVVAGKHYVSKMILYQTYDIIVKNRILLNNYVGLFGKKSLYCHHIGLNSITSF